MDSMMGLNTSLPGTAPPKQSDPPEQLLAAFKAAALSVTNLYKSAAVNQGGVRSEGYQNALEELVLFLDQENIGLDDGEGWRIRKWATERLDGRDTASQHNESDDDCDKTDRGSSPALPRSHNSTRASPLSTNVQNAAPAESDQPPTMTVTTPSDECADSSIPQTTFSFQSAQHYPQDADIVLADNEHANPRMFNAEIPSTSPHVPLSASNFAVHRLSRTRGGPQGRVGSRSAALLGKGSGQKRKINFGDFFDIGNIGHGKDGFGSGKRGRFL
ncbi:unnamed protein product [Blumeria hordei]|uniref:Uncharacterized protein n=2 Tax=Blumeria hordei TaxID=2867405 RepID=A0A383V3D3_BLUHO|nr:hypothetical protein BGHDH14_bgh05238 [Blumeria hordei DH14]SZF06305.1 unnamed protein product [Blumeria hordei]